MVRPAFGGAAGKPRAIALAITLTWACFAGPARAQLAYDGDARGSAAAAAVSFDHTVGSDADRLLLVAVVVGDPDARIMSVGYGGVPLSLVGGVDGPGATCRVELWRRAGPTSGRHLVDVRLSAPAQVHAVAVSYSGVDQDDPVSAPATSTGSGDTASVSLPSAADQMVVDWLCAGGGNVVVGSPAAGQSRRDSWPGDPAGGISDRTATSPATTMSWRSVGSFDWAMGAVALNPAHPAATDAGTGDDAAATDGPAGDATPDAGTVDPGASDDGPTAADAASSPDDAAAITDTPGEPPPGTADAGTAVVKLAVGCACNTTPAPAPPLVWLLLVALPFRRRRR